MTNSQSLLIGCASTILAVMLVIVSPYECQSQPSISAKSEGKCSPAVVGSHNIIIIKCSVDPAYREKIIELFNKILKNEIDTDKIMAKLDEIEVAQAKSKLIPRDLDSATKMQLMDYLSPDQEVSVVAVPSDPEADRFARQIYDFLNSKNFHLKYGGVGYALFTPQPTGLHLQKEDNVQEVIVGFNPAASPY